MTQHQNMTVSAIAILNDARQFHEAAEIVFQREPRLTRPLNALYFHIVEVLLKAFLLAHNRDPWGHEIGKLYDECRDLGLKVEADDRFNLGNVVSLLESGNEDMAFRYFSLESRTEPELNWTREVVANLMRAVSAFVDPSGPATTPGPTAKLTMEIGKPIPKVDVPTAPK